MTLDDIKGRTYTDPADFWRDLEKVIADVKREERQALLKELMRHADNPSTILWLSQFRNGE